MGMGDIDRSKGDLTLAFAITDGKDISVINGIQQLKAKIARDKEIEREFSKKMLTSATPIY